MTHTDIIKDADAFFEIDPITRVITNKTPDKTKVMQYDHNSERFTFSLPQYIEGHDMLNCKVEVHYININTNTKEETQGLYKADDVQMHPEDSERIIFSWLLSQNVTMNAGVVHFLIRFSCEAEDGTLYYAWSSEVYKAISVAQGIYNAESLATFYADVLENWKYELFSASAEGVKNIYTARASSLADIQTEKDKACEIVEQKGQSVADSLPDDYIKLSDKVKNVSNALKGTAKSSNSLVSMHDVSPLEHIMSVNVKKKSSSIPWSDVKVKKYGKNILDVANAPMYHTNAYKTAYTWERTETGFKTIRLEDAENTSSRNGYFIGTKDELKGKTITVHGKYIGERRTAIAILSGDINGTYAKGETGPTDTINEGRVSSGNWSTIVSMQDTETLTVTIPNDTPYPYIAVFFYMAIGTTLAGDAIEWSNLQVEISDTATEYVPYQEAVTYAPNEDGTIEGVTSLYPTTTLMTDTSGVIINCDYNRDINKAYDELKQAILSLGDNI